MLGAGAAKLSEDYINPAVTIGFSDGVKSNADGTGEVRFGGGASDEQTREIEIPLVEDSAAEGNEVIWIKLTFQDKRNLVFPRSSQNLERSILWVKGTVSDKFYSVTITSDEGNEGETLTFEVAVEGKGAGTVEYVTDDGLGAHTHLQLCKRLFRLCSQNGHADFYLRRTSEENHHGTSETRQSGGVAGILPGTTQIPHRISQTNREHGLLQPR